MSEQQVPNPAEEAETPEAEESSNGKKLTIGLILITLFLGLISGFGKKAGEKLWSALSGKSQKITYRIRIQKLKVARTKANGKAWDNSRQKPSPKPSSKPPLLAKFQQPLVPLKLKQAAVRAQVKAQAPDLMVHIQIKGRRRILRTSVVKNSFQAKWKRTWRIRNRAKARVIVKVFDRDKGKKELIGKIKLPLRRFLKGKELVFGQVLSLKFRVTKN